VARIEWAALSGDEVETVVSMLIYNAHPRATRIRPSQGDYGIDLLAPHPDENASADVWQIKKFATNLTSSQKSQIEDSFRRVLVGLVRRNVPLADWYLVMPLDPTLENHSDWFQKMPDSVIAAMFDDNELALTGPEKQAITEWREAPGRVIEWKGLTYCETLAAKFWFVSDYYLHGGRDRVNSAISELAKILQRDITLPSSDTRALGTSDLEPAEIREHLGRLGKTLQGDPHFEYGFSVDPMPRGLPQAEPRLVAATQQVEPGGMTITFRIFARFDEALNERPIPIDLRFQAEPGTPEWDAIKDWQKYGTTLTTTAHVNAPLPGGLGGSFTNVTARISPAADAPERIQRYRLIAPDDSVLAELTFLVVSTTGLDGTGTWIHGKDTSGIVTVDGRFDVETLTGKFNFSFEDMTGRDVVDAAPAIRFASSLARPNRLQLAAKHGPFRDFQEIPVEEAPIPPFAALYVSSLATIQDHVSRPLTVPDLTEVTVNEARAVIRAAKLLNGKTIVGTWTTLEITVEDASFAPDGHYQLETVEPLAPRIGGETIVLGAVVNRLLSVTLTDAGNGTIRAEPHLNDTAHQTLAPNEPVPSTDHKPVRSRAIPEPPPEQAGDSVIPTV